MTNTNRTRLTAVSISTAILLIGAVACWSPVNETARARFEARTEPATVSVYPVHVVKSPDDIEHDADLAVQLARFLDEEDLARAHALQQTVEFPFEGGMNQAAMLGRSGERFGRQVAAAGIETDYALLVEVLTNRDETSVGGVHYYLAEKSGAIADARLSNSHHPDFKQVQPKNRDDGCEVARRMIQEAWADARMRSRAAAR
jgi:hypothetical protein